MRWLPTSSMFSIATLLAGCSVSEPMEPEESRPPVVQPIEADPIPPEITEGPAYFFAVLGQSGVSHCPDGASQTWLALRPTLGFVPSSGATEHADALMDMAVLARGTSGPARPRPALDVTPVPCPPMQMRSDWVDTPRGIRVLRHPKPDIEHFHATSVRKLDELKVIREGEELLVSFENPLDVALTDVELVMHYEGCYGKPGTVSRSSDGVALEIGAKIEQRFPLFAEAEGPRRHRAGSLSLRLRGPEQHEIHVDLAVSLRAFAIEFEC